MPVLVFGLTPEKLCLHQGSSELYEKCLCHMVVSKWHIQFPQILNSNMPALWNAATINIIVLKLPTMHFLLKTYDHKLPVRIMVSIMEIPPAEEVKNWSILHTIPVFYLAMFLIFCWQREKHDLKRVTCQALLNWSMWGALLPFKPSRFLSSLIWLNSIFML